MPRFTYPLRSSSRLLEQQGGGGEIVEIDFKLWGAAGGTEGPSPGTAGNLGGHGGFVSGKLWLAKGTVLVLQVGEGGLNGDPAAADIAYPAGGESSPGIYGQGGGGRSAIFLDSVSQANAVAIAGAGGGSGWVSAGSGSGNGGSGGAGENGNGEDGEGDNTWEGGGGTQVAGGSAPGGGTAGSALSGGGSPTNGKPSGGDGWYGGGQGSNGAGFAGAGGGSNFVSDRIGSVLSTGQSSRTSTSAPENGDPDYAAGIAQANANGNGTRGGNGRIVLTIDGEKTIYDFTGFDVTVKV